MESDYSLLEAARRMDQETLIAIFDRYATALYNYAMRMCGNPVEADQAVGDVFAKFLEQLAPGKGPDTNLRAYLYKMIYHHMLDDSRLFQREAPLEVADFKPGDNEAHSLDSNLENKALMDVLIVAIKNRLTVDQRHVIVLRFTEGFNLLETAQIVGKRVGTVRVTQSRAIAKLRMVLSKVSE
jgi:RNA polymerase sigma-70 factor, ECF subfamily